MQIITDGPIIKLLLTPADTHKWATIWPCSVLSGKTLYAEFDEHGDLIDYVVEDDYGPITIDIPADEFTALTSDFLLGIVS